MPINIKKTIPINNIESIDINKIKNSTEFTIKMNNTSNNNNNMIGNDSDNGSIMDDSSDTKISYLQAEDAQTRLLWVTMLSQVLRIATSS